MQVKVKEDAIRAMTEQQHALEHTIEELTRCVEEHQRDALARRVELDSQKAYAADLQKTIAGCQQQLSAIPASIDRATMEYSAQEENMARTIDRMQQQYDSVLQNLKEREKTIQQLAADRLKAEKRLGESRHNMEKRLTQLSQDNQNKARYYEQMSRAFAHRLRDIIGIASAKLQWVNTRYPLSDDIKNNLGVVDQHIELLDKTLDDMVFLCIPPLLKQEIIDLNQMALNTCRAASLRLAPALPTILGDETLLTRCLQELLNNAQESGADSIAVNTGYNAEQGAMFITMTDNGIGMDDALRNKAGSPFLTTKPNHTGMGLAYAKRVIELHGGSLRFEKAQAKGTIVTVIFPEK
jgi:signal transduction histidine kinase